MSVSTSPAVNDNYLEVTESMYAFFKELFLAGSLTIPANERSLDVIEAEFLKSVKSEGEVIRFTYKGMNEFRTEYTQKVLAGTEEVDSIKYFACGYAELTAAGYDGPAAIGSSASMVNYIGMLNACSHLTISDKTCAYDYAVLDFIDEVTGESYDLFPGDTVVLVDEGYVVHKFSELA